MRALSSVLILCAGLMFVGHAKADEASHRKVILEFFKLADMEGLMNSSMDTMLQTQMQTNPGLAPLQDIFKRFFATIRVFDYTNARIIQSLYNCATHFSIRMKE